MADERDRADREAAARERLDPAVSDPLIPPVGDAPLGARPAMVPAERPGGRRWIWIALAALVVLLILWWLMGGTPDTAPA